MAGGVVRTLSVLARQAVASSAARVRTPTTSNRWSYARLSGGLGPRWHAFRLSRLRSFARRCSLACAGACPYGRAALRNREDVMSDSSSTDTSGDGSLSRGAKEFNTRTAAQQRDSVADGRDVAAAGRDALAKGRDDVLDAADAELEEMRGGDVDVVRRLADRLTAAGSRAAARSDRSAGAGDRLAASSDREAARADLMAEGVDELTGALRRQVGMAAVGRELERTRRTDGMLTVAFVDVDGLKAINDVHGHPAGDALLRGLVECIKRALRPYDLVVRYGGDEFFCALTDQDAVRSAARFATIHATFAERHGGAFSVGFAEARTADTPVQLVERADADLLALPGRQERRFRPSTNGKGAESIRR